MPLQHLKTITVTPTVDTLAYATGDLIGGLLTFDGVRRIGGAALQTVTLVDQAKQNAAIDLVLFSGSLGGTTLTDNAALDVADADLLTYLGHVSIAAANYASFNDNSAAAVRDVNLYLTPAATGTAIYGVLVSRGSPTYAAATDLRLTLTFARE